MKTEENNLDRFKGTNPFSVPEGYMEDLTANIMSRIPEKSSVETKKISMMDRVRPWLYMAAVFAGMGLFFKALIYFNQTDENKVTDSLLVKSNTTASTVSAKQVNEDQEYLEFLEKQYTGYILAEEMDNFE